MAEGSLKTPIRVSIATWTIAVVAFASSAHAAPIGYGAYVHGFINNENCGGYSDGAGPIWGNDSNCMFDGTDPRFFAPNFYGNVAYSPHTSATAALSDADELITASANLATGDLSIELTSSGSAWYSAVTALMWDTLTFHFNDNAQHLVSVTMSGENWGNTSTYYRLELFQPPDPNYYPQSLTMAQGVIPLPGGVYSVSTSMLVQNGMSVGVLAGMSMAGGGGSSGIAWDPLMFSLDGGTFTAESGVLLTQTEVAPVPEPTTLALMGTGLAAAAVRRWRPRRNR